MNSTIRVALLAALTLLPLGGTAFAQQGPNMANGEPALAPTAAAAQIRPGDQVSLRIFREPDLGGVFTVGDGGEVVLPRLGRMVVTEMSAVALQDSLLTAYATYLRNPAVEVTVLRRIGVHGEVRRPDIYMADLTMTLRDVIARAGGVTEAGNPNNIVIVRGNEELRLTSNEAARYATAELRSGDQIFVGRRSWIALNPYVAISTATGLVTFFIGLIQLVK